MQPTNVGAVLAGVNNGRDFLFARAVADALKVDKDGGWRGRGARSGPV
jgi:hypothetical protein